MGIDYTKHRTPAIPSAAPPPPPPGFAPPAFSPAAPPPPPPTSAPTSAPVVLTKAAPAVSLVKQSGVLRVNLNWNARAHESRGLFRKADPALDLDLGCLYEFTDGRKGVVQALGNAFTASTPAVRTPIITLDGDDRSGAVSGGENLLIDLAHVSLIKRILVFALIYQGAPNWAAAAGVATLYPAGSAPITIHLDDATDGARVCAIAMLEGRGGDLSVRREMRYLIGGQRALDEAFGWGMQWAAGRK